MSHFRNEAYSSRQNFSDMADQEMDRKSVLCFCVFLSISVCNGFNFDPRFSVIKTGLAKDYFGYSVTQHQVVNDPRSPDPVVTENV